MHSTLCPSIRTHAATPIHFTRHAQCRSAQRAIPPHIVALLLATGRRDFDHRGGVRVHLRQKRAQLNFARATSAETLARYRNAYAVTDATDARCVITVGWCELTRRIDPAPRRSTRQ